MRFSRQTPAAGLMNTSIIATHCQAFCRQEGPEGRGRNRVNLKSRGSHEMHELMIHYLPPKNKGKGRPKVRVGYRPEAGAQVQEREVPFKFEVTEEQRR